ncbi:MAG: restriction endonuclease subunit S [Verrucomicrobiales bacterium]|nr:restriction endonuclease subunit S [Verrucomicrobiales bacterium]
MAKWRDCKLGDLLEIKHGFAFRSEHFADAGTHIVLTPGNFFDEGGFKHKADKEKWYRGPIPADYVLNEGDLIVAMTEQAEGLLGSSAIVPRSGIYLHNQRLGLVQLRDSKRADRHFVYYLFNSKPVRQQIRASASGVKIRHTAPTRIAEVKVSVPPLPVQRRIAGILSAYDELIDNSQRRIRVLEAMARALYREWFVHFRFPGSRAEAGAKADGYEGDSSPSGRGRGEGRTQFVTSPLGQIPKGWEVKKLGELTAYLNRGLSPSYDDNGDSMVINQKCIRDQRLSLEPARRQTKPIPPDKQVRFGDVLINSTGVGTLGRVAQVYQTLDGCTVDTHVTIARSNSETDLDFFGCTLLAQQETFDRLGVGATGQTELSRTSIANVELVVPPADIQTLFGEAVRPMRKAAITLATQIQTLRRTRDLLLPRLLSGQVELETEVP